jgi:uncharacterized alkaline shock family protein YloU
MAAANNQQTSGPSTDGLRPTEENVRVPASTAGAVRGGVLIAENVVEMIAATAALKVPGIYPGGGPDGIASEISRAFGGRQTGIRAKIKKNREVDLEMRMTVEYGEHIPTRGEQVRIEAAKAIRELTDLEPREIKVKVTDVILAKSDRPATDESVVSEPLEEAQTAPVV